VSVAAGLVLATSPGQSRVTSASTAALDAPTPWRPGDDGYRHIGALRQKMAAYQANGARLGWLLLPQEQAVEVWPASGPPQRLDDADVLDAAAEFPGLQLQLAEIWAA